MGKDETNTRCDTQEKVYRMIVGRLPEWLKGSDLKSEEGLWSSASSNLAPSFEKKILRSA